MRQSGAVVPLFLRASTWRSVAAAAFWLFRSCAIWGESGYTNGAMAVAKLLGFDLCPRLQDLAERKLYLPPGFAVPEGIERATVKRLSRKTICTGWDELLRVAASIRIGKISSRRFEMPRKP